MTTAQSVSELLDRAAKCLEKAAYEIRDLPLEPRSEHIRRIGAALSEISEIQYHLYALEPNLTPPWLAEPFENPEGAWNVALLRARKAEEGGHAAMAIAILRWFSAYTVSSEFHALAKSEIQRLEGKDDA